MTFTARVIPSLLLLPLLLLPLAESFAQDSSPPAEAEAEAAADGANSVQVEQERVRELIATLEDEQRRQELVAQLRLLIEAQETQEPAEEPSSIGDQLLGQLALQFEALGDAVDAVLATPDSIADMASWLEADVGTESGRNRWQDILRAAAISLGAAVIAFFAFAIPLRRFKNRLGVAAQTALGRIARRIAAALLDAVPVIAFAAVGSAALAAIEKGMVARLMTADLLSVLTISLAARALVRIVTRPRRPALRLLRVSDGVARDMNRSLLGIIVVMTVAYAVTETLPMIGMPGSARQAVLTIAALAATVMLILTIVRHRRPVQQAIQRSAAKGTLIGDFLGWFAGVWHIAAIGLVIFLLVAYIVGGDGLFITLVWRIAWSALVIAVGLGLWRLVVAYVERERRRTQPTEDGGDIVRESSGLLLRLFARLALATLTIGLLVHIWLFDVGEWLGNEAGRDLVEAVVTIAIILVLAYAANRAIMAVIQRIQISGRAGPAIQQRRRLETLLPLLRSAAAVIIISVTVLIVLSEIGLDIAPLLASAGVVGIAIGFGAQSLVKDVVTGLFFLMEDAFGVGDIVTVAGYSGVVEELSIRSIKLRDFAGVVHVIPFGVVDAASNMTRDFSFAVFDVGVAYDSDVDEVTACMREADAELRTDQALAPGILEPIEIVGLDQFGDNAIVIKARIKTRPAKQWGVMRAYNRILKRRFDEAGIEIPFPQRTLHIVQPRREGEPKPVPTSGTATPLDEALEGE